VRQWPVRQHTRYGPVKTPRVADRNAQRHGALALRSSPPWSPRAPSPGDYALPTARGARLSARGWPCAYGPPRGQWVRRHDHLRQCIPSGPCCCPCTASLLWTASCTPARVCTSLSLMHAVP